jgi:hypothetical protein
MMVFSSFLAMNTISPTSPLTTAVALNVVAKPTRDLPSKVRSL